MMVQDNNEPRLGRRIGGRIEPTKKEPLAPPQTLRNGVLTQLILTSVVLLLLLRSLFAVDTGTYYYSYSSVQQTTVRSENGEPRTETQLSCSLRTNIPGLAQRMSELEQQGDGRVKPFPMDIDLFELR
jgi:hypothetical protein